MDKKKIFTDVLVIIIALAMFIIWNETKFDHRAITTTSLPNYKIYLITMDKTSHYWHIVDQGASDMAELSGVTYLWDAPIERNVDEQIDIIRRAIKDGADALLIAASDSVKVSEAVEEAKAANIKIIYVDAPANAEGIVTLATDNYSAGVTAARNMLSELDAAGLKTGSIGILGVTEETITTMNREKGFRDVVTEDGRFKLLPTRYTFNNKTIMQEAVNSFIGDNPDLVGLFGTNEDTTIAVGNAIQSSKKNIIGIGFDITDAIQKMINDGYLKAVMVQNPYTMGYLGMAEALAALKGYDTGPRRINTGVSVKTQFSH